METQNEKIIMADGREIIMADGREIIIDGIPYYIKDGILYVYVPTDYGAGYMPMGRVKEEKE